MNFKYLVFISILVGFVFCKTQDCIESIIKDEVDIIQNAVKDGIDIDEIYKIKASDGLAHHTFLTFSIFKSAKKIIKFLIKNKANVNKMCLNMNNQYGPLLVALLHCKIDICELLLEVEDLNIEDIGFKDNKKISLINVFDFFYFERDKKLFIINCLAKYYGKKLLPKALIEKVGLKSIRELIKVAPITPEIIELAKKLKLDESIIKFLEPDSKLKSEIAKSTSLFLPSDIVNMIYVYAHERESVHESLIASILENDILQIKIFVQNGVDPNEHIMHKFNNLPEVISISLLMIALNLGFEEIANYLIDSGADVNEFQLQGREKVTPLYIALLHDKISLDLVKKILSKTKLDYVYIDTMDSLKFTIKQISHLPISDEKRKFLASYVENLPT